MKWFLLLLLLTLTSCFKNKNDSSYNWLEDIDSKVALKWVGRESNKSLDEMSKDEAFEKQRLRILKRLESKEKLLRVQIQDNFVYNFWKDENYPRGLWRRAPLNLFIKGKDYDWENLLDIGLLSKQESKKWVYKGVHFIPDSKDNVVLKLSDGGKDASYLREFSLQTKTFLSGKNAFDFPESRYTSLVLNQKQMLIGDTLNSKYLTSSNYPRRLKLFTKGEDPRKSPEVLTIPKDHTALWAYSIPIKGDKFHHIIIDAIDFFNSEKYIYSAGKLIKIPIPKSSEILNAFENTFIISLKEDLNEKGLKSGDVASIQLKKDGSFSDLSLLIKVKNGQAIQNAVTTKKFVVFSVRENVSKKAYKFNFSNKKLEPLSLDPEVSIMDSSTNSNTILITQSNFLNANQLAAYNLKKDSYKTLQKEKEYFDSSPYTYSQDWAISKDGTRVPFYIIHKKNLEKNSVNPTIMYGYGGFEISLSPFYLKNRVPEWVSQGGVFVLSNIRGGGEFGPDWHKAAQKFNKKKSYEDFAAIARRLFELKITSSDHLGIVGGSNGGLLVGASSVLYPDLYKSAFCAVPLLDMLRYDQLLVGASWISEYGDPKIKKERDYIRTYSPFHNVEKNQDYPTIFFYTSTFDDRVHPAHARKMYKKMIDQEHKAYYYENSEGGHAGSADLEQRALMDTLKFTFFRKTLGIGKE